MKSTLIYLCWFFFVCELLSAQSAFQFNEYDDLRPDVNFLAKRILNSNDKRILLFQPPLLPDRETKPILICNMPENIISLLPNEQIGFEKRHMGSTYFWEPHTKLNYMYCRDPAILRDEKRGWYLLGFFERFLSFYMKNNNQYWASHAPPVVQLTDTRVFTTLYEIEQYDSRINPRGFLTAHKTSFLLTDTKLSKTVWELNIASQNFANLYWITEQWYFILDGYYFVMGEAKRQNTIYNYETKETISFGSECIIGYGNGVVLTTNETEEGLVGITVWAPEEKILYRDSTFSISGILDREQGRITRWRPNIYISYFDYPYIYCNISQNIMGLSPPYGTLIMNLIDGKTYFTPYGYHLFGIFEP